MTFISTRSRCGDICVLTQNVVAMKGTLTEGSAVEITNIGPRGYDIKDIQSGEKFTECGYNIFDKIIEED